MEPVSVLVGFGWRMPMLTRLSSWCAVPIRLEKGPQAPGLASYHSRKAIDVLILQAREQKTERFRNWPLTTQLGKDE